MRDIVGKDGVTRNVMDATKSLLKSLESFQTSLGKVAKTLGLSTDPMAILIDIIDNIRYGIDTLALGLGRVSKVADEWGNWAGVGELGFQIGEMVGVWIGKMIAKAFSPQGLMTIGNVALGLLGAIPGLLWGMIKGAFMGLVDAWKPVVDGLVQMIRDGITSLGARIRDTIGSMALSSLVPGGSAIAGAGSFLSGGILEGPMRSVADGIKGVTGIDVGGMMGLPSAPKPTEAAGAKTSTNNISINTPPGVTDPKAVAMFVVDYLENGYRAITQETLTA